MKAIIDKKHNLARGFADLNTPSAFESELLFSYQEQKETYVFKINQLLAELKKTEIGWQRKLINEEMEKYKHKLCKINQQVDKRLNIYQLIIDRLAQVVGQDVLKKCSKQAKLDKKRILSAWRVE